MHYFLRVNFTVYDTFSMVHANPSPYTLKFMLAGVRNNKTLQMRR